MPMTRRRALDVGLFCALLIGGALMARSWNAEPPITKTRKGEKKRGPAAKPLRPPDELSAEERTGPVDLLERVNPDVDAAHGEWKKEGASLLTSAVPWGRLQVPVRPPPDYRLELVVRRLSGGDSLNLGLSNGQRQFMAVLDGNGGKHCGLDLVGGKGFSQNETTVQKRVFADAEPRTIHVRVRPGRVGVSVDGQPLFEWKGDFETLGVMPQWSTHSRQALFIGSFGTRFEIQRLLLTFPAGD
jgi:hypothetical protein